MEQLLEVVNKFSEDSDHLLQRINLTEDAIRNSLRKLKVNQASDLDNIVLRLLVENAECQSEPFLHIFSESVGSGIVPKEWKSANVTAT